MEIIRYPSSDELLRSAGEWLQQSEAENNLILGVANRSSSFETKDGPPAYWAAICDCGEIVGCAFRTPPSPIGLTKLPLESIPHLISDISEFHSRAPGVNGPVSEAEQFAKLWSERYSMSWRVNMRLRIHRLGQVIFPVDAAQGKLRQPLATEDSLIRKWVEELAEEAGLADDPVQAANRLIESGNVGIWDWNGPRCIVAGARETPSGVCINAVYTPVEHRRSGYATIAVATFSQEQLDSGKEFCCLYTDVDNPTSNSIYAKIGYEYIRDDVHIEFDRGVEISE